MSYVGIDYLALLHKSFPARKAMQVFDGVQRPALGFLSHTFGTDWRNLGQAINMIGDRPHLIRVHMTNQWCVRHGVCYRGEVRRRQTTRQWNRRLKAARPKFSGVLKNRCLQIVEQIETYKNSNTEVWLSLGLEDNFSDDAAFSFVKIIEDVCPYPLIRNPVDSNSHQALAGCDGLELHGLQLDFPRQLSRVQCFSSLDGRGIQLPHYRHRPDNISVQRARRWLSESYSKSHATFLWLPEHQSNTGSSSVVPPRKRNIGVDRRDLPILNDLLLNVRK